jgi:hypothetical protein
MENRLGESPKKIRSRREPVPSVDLEHPRMYDVQRAVIAAGLSLKTRRLS